MIFLFAEKFGDRSNAGAKFLLHMYLSTNPSREPGMDVVPGVPTI